MRFLEMASGSSTVMADSGLPQPRNTKATSFCAVKIAAKDSVPAHLNEVFQQGLTDLLLVIL